MPTKAKQKFAVMRKVKRACFCQGCDSKLKVGVKAPYIAGKGWYCDEECLPMNSYTFGTTPKAAILAGVKRCPNKLYFMSLVGSDFETYRRVVNIGIDSHLEAIASPGRSTGRGRDRRRNDVACQLVPQGWRESPVVEVVPRTAVHSGRHLGRRCPRRYEHEEDLLVSRWACRHKAPDNEAETHPSLPA